jgi:hypothetical protein
MIGEGFTNISARANKRLVALIGLGSSVYRQLDDEEMKVEHVFNDNGEITKTKSSYDWKNRYKTPAAKETIVPEKEEQSGLDSGEISDKFEDLKARFGKKVTPTVEPAPEDEEFALSANDDPEPVITPDPPKAAPRKKMSLKNKQTGEVTPIGDKKEESLSDMKPVCDACGVEFKDASSYENAKTKAPNYDDNVLCFKCQFKYKAIK